MTPSRRLLIACKIFDREIRAVLGDAPVDVAWLPQGLHGAGAAAMRAAIQATVNLAPPCDRILLGYGFCGRGLEGLRAGAAPLVVPRAHDCLAMLIGDGAEYERRVRDHPGTYWRSCGWIEQVPPDPADRPARQLTLDPTGASPYTWEQLVEKFGEEDAREIGATLSGHTTAYDRIAFIETGAEPDRTLAARARDEAARRGWEYERVPGNLGWIRRLVHGPWVDREFLIVPPGSSIAPAYDGTVIRATAA